MEKDDNKNTDIAVIFRAEDFDGIYNFYVDHVALGYLNEDGLFVSEAGDEYFHIYDYAFLASELEKDDELCDNYVFAYRKKISDLYSVNKNTAEIMDSYLKNYSKYAYYFNDANELVYFVDTSSDIAIENVLIDIDSNERFDLDEDEDLDDFKEEILKKNSNKSTKYNYETFTNVDFRELSNELKNSIIGQNNTIESVVGTLYYNLNLKGGKALNMLLVGDTGVGKTEIFRIISKYYPCLIEDISQYTQSGYVGKDVDMIFQRLLSMVNDDVRIARKSIIMLDEIDKKSGYYNGEDNVAGISVLNELLKRIEGDSFQFSYKYKTINFDTFENMFVFSGAFSGMDLMGKNSIGFTPLETKKALLEDTICKYGLTPEFLGRISVIEQLNKLTYEDLYNIATKSLISPFKLQSERFSNIGIDFKYSDEVIKEIVCLAYETKEGARAINKVLSQTLVNACYEMSISDNKYHELELLEGCSSNVKRYVLR